MKNILVFSLTFSCLDVLQQSLWALFFQDKHHEIYWDKKEGRQQICLPDDRYAFHMLQRLIYNLKAHEQQYGVLSVYKQSKLLLMHLQAVGKKWQKQTLKWMRVLMRVSSNIYRTKNNLRAILIHISYYNILCLVL